MQQAQTMTLDEKLAISNRSIALKRAGDLEGSDRLLKTIPMPPYLAKMAKEKIGVDFFIICSSPANWKRWKTAIESVKQGKFITFETLEQAIQCAEERAAAH